MLAKVVSLSAALIMCLTVSAQGLLEASALSLEMPAATTASWDADLHDFGAIPQGTPVSHRFLVTNTGEVPLTITGVKASCGCTATAYTTTDIAPGESGYVEAVYNAAGVGFFNKSVTVHLNTDTGTMLLRLKGQVMPNETDE